MLAVWQVAQVEPWPPETDGKPGSQAGKEKEGPMNRRFRGRAESTQIRV